MKVPVEHVIKSFNGSLAVSPALNLGMTNKYERIFTDNTRVRHLGFDDKTNYRRPRRKQYRFGKTRCVLYLNFKKGSRRLPSEALR